MVDFQAVYIDALWILGLAGVLATFSYYDWKRSFFGWGWRRNWKLPGFLLPLNLSLTVFCLGLALNGATAYVPDPWWQTAIWALMTLVFAAQVVIYARLGRANGWDEPIEETGATDADDGAGEPAGAAENVQ